MNPSVVAIYTGDRSRAPLHAEAAVTLEAGRGIVGDRYHAGIGTFSEKHKGKPDTEVTLIEIEEIERFNGLQGVGRAAGDFRRNIVTRDVRLNDLVGRQFFVGTALLEGIRLCEPCSHLAQLLSPAVLPDMVHRAGLRARIVVGAVVHSGDPITFEGPG